MNKFYSVIIIYNTKIDESITYQRITNINCNNNTIIIIDNSTDINIKNYNLNYQEFNTPTIYIDMEGNKGLSKAYNTFLNKNIAVSKNDIIIWLDDDTKISKEYYFELDDIAKKNLEIDIFTPIIQGQDGTIWSPNNDAFIRNKQLKSPKEQVDKKRYNAINSCTAVRATVYGNYRYDERLFLDQVDHLFFYHQREKHAKFYQMKSIINHDFSLKEKKPKKENLKKRYEIMIPDFLKYAELRNAFRPLIYVKIIGWGIRESIRLKDITFLFWITKKALES